MFKTLLCVVVAGGLSGAGWAQEPEVPKDPPRIEIQTPDVLPGPPAVIRVEAVAEEDQPGQPMAVKLGEYWLGLACRAVDAEARKALKLPEEGGVLVEHVIPDSPADKAGIKPGDVIFKSGDTVLKTPADLVEAVNAAKDMPMKFDVRREGKPHEITVAPGKRPPLPHERPGSPQAELDKAMKWLDRFQREAGEAADPHTFRWQAFGPGLILRGDVLIRRPIPDDMTITITKSGKKPVEITVTQGDKRWECTEDKIDELPKDVRPHVEGLLGRFPAPMAERFRVLEAPAVPVPVVPGMPVVPRVERLPRRDEGSIEKRLDEISRRLEELSRTVEELRRPAEK